MKRRVEKGSFEDMRPEYNFGSMKGGVRGKHYNAYRRGANVVLLKPDVAAAFPNEEAVNEALRGILSTTRAVRRIGGLPDRALATGASKRGRRRS